MRFARKGCSRTSDSIALRAGTGSSDHIWEITMNRKGFTLIELLIVVVIIGILAAIAIPKFANTKEKAYLASMKSDLRNLGTAEEAYIAESHNCTPATAPHRVNSSRWTKETQPATGAPAPRRDHAIAA